MEFTQACFKKQAAGTEIQQDFVRWWCVFFLSLSPAFGQGAPGVSEGEVLIGSCSALEGPSHFLGRETVTGAKAYFDMTNDTPLHHWIVNVRASYFVGTGGRAVPFTDWSTAAPK